MPAPPGSAAADFEAWARERGVGGAITIASFGALRGCAAVRDVAPGEALLSIPADVLIYEDTVRQTDLVGGWMDGCGCCGWPACLSGADACSLCSRWLPAWRAAALSVCLNACLAYLLRCCRVAC